MVELQDGFLVLESEGGLLGSFSLTSVARDMLVARCVSLWNGDLVGFFFDFLDFFDLLELMEEVVELVWWRGPKVWG